MSPLTPRPRRRTSATAVVLALLAGAGLAGTGPAPGAAAAAGGACDVGGYQGDASVGFSGTAEVGAPATVTFVPGTDWTRDASAEISWSARGLGAPVAGRTLVPRPDLVGAPAHATVVVRAPGHRTVVIGCDVARIGWGHRARPAAPVVTGDVTPGGTLRVAPAAADDAPAGATYHYQWFADGESRGTGDRLVLGAAEAGRAITVKTMLTGLGFLDTDWSPARVVGTVEGGVLDAPSAVTVSGTAEVGATLSAVVDGAWTPGTDVSYSWLADGEPFGTDAESAILTDAEAGALVRVQVTGTLAGYTSRTVTSDPVGPVVGGAVPELPATPDAPTVSGVAQVGRVLTAAPAATDPTWPAGASYHYEWTAGGDVLGTEARLTLAAGLVGRTVTVRTYVTAPGYVDSAWSTPSLPTAPVAEADLATPSAIAVRGTARVGATLTAHATGTWTEGTRVVHTWRADGVAFGGHATTVTLGAAQRGKAITVEAVGTLAGHTPATVTSPATARVAAGVLRAGKPRIVGTAQVGRVVTVRPGTWTPATRLTYRWFVDGRAIAGATRAGLRIGARLQGHRITVRVTGTKPGYATLTRTSAGRRVR